MAFDISMARLTAKVLVSRSSRIGSLPLKERAVLIGLELDMPRVAAMLGGRQGISPEHTTFSGNGELRYRSLAAADFRRIGVMSELHGDLAGKLALTLAGNPLPPVTDQWLRELRVA